MRKTHPAILDGDLTFHMEDSDQVLMYTRACARETLLIIANKSDEAATIALPEELASHSWKLLLTNCDSAATGMERGRLAPWECEIYTLQM